MTFDPTFFVAASVVLFFLAAARPAGRFIAGGLDKRSAEIKKQLDDASRLKEEAQVLLAGYQRKREKAQEEAEEIISHAQLEAERILALARDQLDRDLAKRTEMVLQKIAQAEDSVVQEIRDQAVDITISAARRIIVEQLQKEDADDIVRAAIGNIEGKLH